MKKLSKEELSEYREKKKEEFMEYTELLEKSVRTVFTGEKMREYLDFSRRMPSYSINNQILIFMQKPEATMCAPYTAWPKFGRHVKAGEHGIKIFARCRKKQKAKVEKIESSKQNEKEEEEEEKIVNKTFYTIVTTFDISQTEGEEVPAICHELSGSVENYETLQKCICKVSPVPIEYGETGRSFGYYSPSENRIVVKEGLSELHTIKTSIHEVAHAILHSGDGKMKGREQKECEAEGVAYMVASYYGLDTSEYSFEYIASWAGSEDVKILKESLSAIQETAAVITEKIDSLLETEQIEKEAV